MASGTDIGPGGIGGWRIAGWGIALAILLLPFAAMQFTSDVNWTRSDFLFAALLIGAVGLLFELTVRASDSKYYRGGVALALAVSFLIIRATGAVGMIGDEGDPLNLMFAGVLLVAIMGSAFARFRAAGMARAMLAAAAAQFLAGTFGMFADLLGGIYSAMFAGLWLASAALFRRAGKLS